MRCPQCEAEVLDKDRFCYACGADLSAPPVAARPTARPADICPRCGQALDPADRFCGYCGAETAPAGKAASAGAASEPLSRPIAQPVLQRTIQPSAQPSDQPVPRAARSHWVAVLLAYLNILVSLAVLGFGYILLQSPSYQGSYYPFMVARYALVSLIAGMLVFGIYLWTRKTRRDRRQARAIVIISIIAIAAGVMLFA